VLGREQDRVGEAELVDLVQEVLLAGVVRLVGAHHHRPPGAPEHQCDVPVERGQALANVDEQHDRLRLLDRDLSLRLDGGARGVVGAFQVQPGGVDHRDLAPSPFAHAVEPVARQAGRGVDDRLAPAQQAVEKRGFADVGAPDDRNDGACHETPI